MSDRILNRVKAEVKDRGQVAGGNGMNAHHFGRPAPDRAGFVRARSSIAELLDGLGYSLGEIAEVLDYIRAHGSVEGYPFFDEDGHRALVEDMIPEATDDRWACYEAWHWSTVR